MLRNLSRDNDDRSTTSLVGRMARYRRPSNASSHASSHPSASPYQQQSFSPQISKHTYLSPEERRYNAEAACYDASASPHSSHTFSPNINYNRDLPQLPPEALADVDTNQLASRDRARTDEEVRSRHYSQFESLPALASPVPAKAESSSRPSAALRFATASTSAAVSAAGSGLRKLGKKASAARLRRPSTTPHQAAELDASYAAIRSAPSPNSFASDAMSFDHTTLSGSDATYDSAHARKPSASPADARYTFVDSADPNIGLPYDVAHNVHVDIGPHGYTGLPSSWAQVLLSEGMDQQNVYDDPHAAARLVHEKTEYFVQRAVDSGGDADDARRILTQTLAADPQLSAVLASAAPSRPSRPRRDSTQSSASSSYSSVLEKGWDLSSPSKPETPSDLSLLPAKSPLLPDFAAEDFDEWSTSLLSSIPAAGNGSKTTSPQNSKRGANKASQRRSGSPGQITGSTTLSGLGIGIETAHATPKHNVQRGKDLLSTADATPKASQASQASQRMHASLGLHAKQSLPSNSIEDEMQERLRESLDLPQKGSCHLDDEEADVEHVQIAQAAVVTKRVLRPVRASQLSARKVSPSATCFESTSPHMSPSSSASDLQMRLPRSPSNLSDSGMLRCGSADSYATAGSQPVSGSRGSFSNAPPSILTKNAPRFVDSDMTSSPVETSSTGHSSSMRMRSPSLTVATSSMGHSSTGIPHRTTPSPSLSVRDLASPQVPPKEGDWRSRSPALSVSTFDSREGGSSPSGTQYATRPMPKASASLDVGHTIGHQTQDSWASSAPSITSSEGAHTTTTTRGLGLRERRQAPPRIYPPSTSTRWAHIAHQEDSSSPVGSAGSNRRMQPSPTIQAPMQRKASAESLGSRPDRSPMSDHSHGSRSSVQTGFRRRESDGLSQQSHGQSSAGASIRDSMPPPPPPPKPTPAAVRRQPEYILPGADGFYTMPTSSASAARSDVGSVAKLPGLDRLRPPPLHSPALSAASSNDGSDYHTAIEQWMHDEYSDRSPAATTFSEAMPSPSTSNRDSPLPPLPTQESDAHEQVNEPGRSSPYLQLPGRAAAAVPSQEQLPSPQASESMWHTAALASKSSSGNASPARERSPRLPSVHAPQLDLSDMFANASSFEASFPPPASPSESVEMLNDQASSPHALSSRDAGARSGSSSRSAGKKGKHAGAGNRDRDDTRSIISIGPRAQDDARRFPVSMHYASGFETASMLGDDSEAIRSFRELMLARQSMDLEEMLPMQMGLESAPPVPALPSMQELQAKVAAADQMRVQDAQRAKAAEPSFAKPLPPSVDKEPVASAAASHSLSQEDKVDGSLGTLPPKLSHLRDALSLQPLQKDVLRDLQMIGDGESGPVFAANDVVKKRRVAIKMVQFANNRDEEPSARLLGLVKEVGVWRRCRHVNILDIYSTVLTDDAIWMVHELAERSLADVIAWKDSGVDLNEARMSRVMGDLVEALQFLHGKGVLHRDVRSDNVMVSSTGVCKLSDFTHAGELSAGVTTRRSVVGTPYWMAPEVIKANKYDVRCDVWSLGVVLWEMIEGDPPRVEFPPLRAITLTASLGLPALRDPASLSHELKLFLHWATEMDAEKRPSAEMLGMSDFLADPCSRASIVAMLEEAKHAEMEANKQEAGTEAEEQQQGSNGRHETSAVARQLNGSLRHRESWSSDTTTKG